MDLKAYFRFDACCYLKFFQLRMEIFLVLDCELELRRGLRDGDTLEAG
jgi:hypothetical protein